MKRASVGLFLALSVGCGPEAPISDNTAPTTEAAPPDASSELTTGVNESTKPADTAPTPDKIVAGLKELGAKIEFAPDGITPTSIDLSSVTLVDSNLDDLPLLDSVHTLKLGYTGINDGMLARLSGMTKVATVYLNRAQITDAGAAHLAKMTGLRSVFLNETAIGDAGIAVLASLPQLASLGLQGTNITDAGLEALAKARLYVLYLDSTAITDAGLKHLTSQDTLHTLRVRDTAVTDAGIAALKEALPRCNITK